MRYSSYIYCRKPSRQVHPVFFRRRRVRCRARFCQLLTIEMRKIRNSNPDFILTFRRFRQRRNVRWIVSTHYSDWIRFASHNLAKASSARYSFLYLPSAYILTRIWGLQEILPSVSLIIVPSVDYLSISYSSHSCQSHFIHKKVKVHCSSSRSGRQ